MHVMNCTASFFHILLHIICLFTYIDIEVQILTEEDLMKLESVDFPSIYNSSMFDKMTPMIQIPTSILLNQMEVQGYATIMYTFTRNVIINHNSGL